MRHSILATLLLLTISSTVWGQAAGTAAGGAIWGKVTDETGAVLPGVSVTLAGASVMGEPQAVTNDQGIYRFPALPPGTFKLTFALTGFNTIVRDGITLTASFTATVDAQLKLSTVAETIEVSGQSPVLDAVNTHVATTWTKDALASTPSARDLWSILAASPAIQMVNRVDVGGSTAGTQTNYVAYGIQGQTKSVVEGIIALEGSNSPMFYYDFGSFEEVNIGAASQGADMATPGVQAVWVSKSGGNAYHGDFYTDYESRRFEASNIDQAQRAKGVLAGSNKIDKIQDLNGGVGGYLKKDALWWYGSGRREQLKVAQSNLLDSLFETRLYNATGKLTYQLNKDNKFVGYAMYGLKIQPYRMVAQSVTGSTAIYTTGSTIEQHDGTIIAKGEWNRTFGDRLFLEARVAGMKDDWTYSPHSTDPRREDLVTQVVTGGTYNWNQIQTRPQTTGALTYFKDGLFGASHNLKLGWELQKEDVQQRWSDFYPGNIVNVFRNSVPAEVYLGLAPLNSVNRLYWYSGYANDTIVRGAVSLNLGLRFDHYRSAYPDQSRPANPFAAAASYSAADNLATWNKFAPRLGLAWKATPRTVIKGNVSRFYFNPSLTVPNAVNPNQSPQWNRYTWTDLNGNTKWDAGEQGTLLGSKAAGSPTALSPALDDPHTDEVAGWLERELGQDFALHTGFVYRRTNDLFLTVNALAPFSAFNVPTTAVDPVTGNVLQLHNLDPSLVGKTLTTLQNAPNWTSHAATWEISANRRFRGGWSLDAAYAVTWRDDISAIPVNPNQPAQSNMLPLSTAKLTGSVEPGWGFRFSPVLRFQQGDPIARVLNVRLNYGSDNIFAEPLGSERKDNVLLADLRTERKFALGSGTQIGLFLDAFNIFNTNAATNIITTTGSSFLRPSTIVAPRVFRVGAKFSF